MLNLPPRKIRTVPADQEQSNPVVRGIMWPIDWLRWLTMLSKKVCLKRNFVVSFRRLLLSRDQKAICRKRCLCTVDTVDVCPSFPNFKTQFIICFQSSLMCPLLFVSPKIHCATNWISIGRWFFGSISFYWARFWFCFPFSFFHFFAWSCPFADFNPLDMARTVSWCLFPANAFSKAIPFNTE